MGPFDALAHRQRLRALLRLHRRRDEPVRPGDLPGHGPDRAGQDRRGGLSLHRGHDRSGDRLDPPAEGAHARQAVLRLLRAGRDPRTHHVPTGVVGQVQGHVRRRLGRPARADLRATEGARRHPAGRGVDGTTRRRSRAGTTCPTTSSRCSLARWRSTRASSSTPTTMSAGSSTSLKELEILDDTLIFYIIGDNGASAEGTPNGCFNELVDAQRRRSASRPPSSWPPRSTSSARRRRTTTTRSAGPTRWIRRTSGRSRSPAIGAGLATARSSIGRTGSRPRARSATSSTMSSTSRRRSSRLPDCRRPTFVNGIQQAPIEGVSMAYSFDDGERRRSAHDAVLRDVRQPRHLPPGLDGRDPALHPVGCHDRSRPSTTTSGSCTGPTTGPRPRPRGRAARAARAAPTPVPDRGRQVQRPAARRPAVRAVQLRSGRPPAADPRQPPGPVRWDGPAVRELGRRHEEQVPCHHGRGRRPGGRRPTDASSRKAARSGAGRCTCTRGSPAYCYNLFGIQRFKVYGDDVVPSGDIRSASSSRMTAAGSARVAPPTLYVDGSKVGEGRVDATVPMVFSADETTDVGTDTGDPGHDDLGGQDDLQRAVCAGSRSTSARTPRTPTT